MAIFGASGTDPLLESMGVLNTLGGSAKAGQQAMDFANQLYPQVAEADPWEAAFQFFTEMGRQASQPGATVLGAAVSSGQAPMDYLNAKKKEKRETDRARMQTAVSLAPSLKAPTVTKAGYTNVTVDGVAQVMTPTEIQAAKKAGKIVSPYDKPSATTGKVTLGKYLDPSRTDDPETKTVNEQIIQLTPVEYQKRMASNNPVYPLSATDSALIDPIDTSLGNARKTVIYGNGTTLSTYDTGTVLRTGGSNEPVSEADFDMVMDEARASGVTDTIRGSAASEAGKSAVQIGTQAFETMGKLVNEMVVLERAKELVLPEGGANTGWLASKLPSIWASSIELDNIQSKLGLAVVGQNTFGALSKGELDLALATALPKTMQEAELADWIDRKIIAQRKLIRHYSDAASYLTDPMNGGIAEWVAIKREAFEAEQGSEALAAAAVITNMSQAEFDAITAADKLVMTVAELQAYLTRIGQ